MIWSFVATAGIGLLAGVLVLRVTLLVLASILTIVAGVVLTPAGWWPVWGAAYLVAMLCTLQFAYLAGYMVACAIARLRAGAERAEQKASLNKHFNASYADWLWPSATDCSV